MSQNLLIDAVNNTRNSEEISLWDRLFAIWFGRLVYTQIWEDPEADMAALDLDPDSSIVTISSGGCNALSYLTARPKRIYAVDLNPTHLALLKLKLAGLKALSDYSQFWQFFGAANEPSNEQIYRDLLRPTLDDDAREYWDGRDLTLRRRSRYFADGFFRHGTLGTFIGFTHWLMDKAGIDRMALLDQNPESRERLLAIEKLDGLILSPLVQWLIRNPAILFSLGIPPRQRDLLAGGDLKDLPRVLRERALKLVAGFAPDQNYFAWQALQRRYHGPGDTCLPPYLQQRHYPTMKAGASKVVPVHANLREFLEGLPLRSIDAVVMLDAQDWMDDQEISGLWRAIDRCGSDKVRILFRTAGTASPLEPLPYTSAWIRDEQRSAIALEQDRSAIYGAVHLYRRR